jgi:mRNA interferase MazF
MEQAHTTSVSIPHDLFAQVEALAPQLHLSPTALLVRALEHFIAEGQGASLPVANLHEHPFQVARQEVSSPDGAQRHIRQGEIYWVALENPGELEPALMHPYVVVQDDLFNESRIPTVVACALTSNIRRTSDTPGNVLLEIGEANLPKQSVVEVSKVSVIEKTRLGDFIGALSAPRVQQILAGMRFLQASCFDR